MFTNSPTQSITLWDKQIFVKRDDLLDTHFSGNKARKFYHFLVNDFPHIKYIVGSGSAQANSLYSLSVLAKINGWQLDYYVSHISEQVKSQYTSSTASQTNYAKSLENGANVLAIDWQRQQFSDCEHLDDAIEVLKPQYIERYGDKVLFVPEGGRCEFAKTGLKQLAAEVLEWSKATKQNDVVVFLPSGTGTTAVYLNQQLALLNASNDIKVQVATCCTVGDESYLTAQFSQLVDDVHLHPIILNDGNKYHFGKLYLPLYQLWQEVQQSTGVEFDLLYDPIGLSVLKHHLNNPIFADKTVLYLHQGGLIGNQSMLKRYQRKLAKTNVRK
ncbi:1-aminocyclopropane-1-carboxylate deaminase/D-cysteine desulfhydrase [Shewanella gaetbuli]